MMSLPIKIDNVNQLKVAWGVMTVDLLGITMFLVILLWILFGRKSWFKNLKQTVYLIAFLLCCVYSKMAMNVVYAQIYDEQVLGPSVGTEKFNYEIHESGIVYHREFKTKKKYSNELFELKGAQDDVLKKVPEKEVPKWMVDEAKPKYEWVKNNK